MLLALYLLASEPQLPLCHEDMEPSWLAKEAPCCLSRGVRSHEMCKGTRLVGWTDVQRRSAVRPLPPITRVIADVDDDAPIVIVRAEVPCPECHIESVDIMTVVLRFDLATDAQLEEAAEMAGATRVNRKSLRTRKGWLALQYACAVAPR